MAGVIKAEKSRREPVVLAGIRGGQVSIEFLQKSAGRAGVLKLCVNDPVNRRNKDCRGQAVSAHVGEEDKPAAVCGLCEVEIITPTMRAGRFVAASSSVGIEGNGSGSNDR